MGRIWGKEMGNDVPGVREGKGSWSPKELDPIFLHLLNEGNHTPSNSVGHSLEEADRGAHDSHIQGFTVQAGGPGIALGIGAHTRSRACVCL